jgi:hypothetical protein
MTISSVPIIIGRIKKAEPWSKIAVFAVTGEEGETKLDAVFADTVVTADRMKNSSNFVGEFSRRMDINAIRRKLKKLVGERK